MATSVTIRRVDGRKFEINSGVVRLIAALDVFGSAMVQDAETGQSFRVVKRGDELVEVEPDSQAQAPK